jgi:glycosyltransferase involved in cell wall biosynthesis
MLRANRRTRALEASLKDFAPDAVLTVAHGFSWITAAELAADRNIPLHLVVHDDLPHMINLVRPAKAWLGNHFANVYKQASSRLCVSPLMVEEYQKRYGCPGTVFYPLRSTVGGSFEEAPQPSNNRPFTVAFAGSLFVGDYIRQLVCLSHLLLNMHGRLLILGPAQRDVLSKNGVALECVALRGHVPPGKFIRFLRAEADVLFVPVSFEPNEVAVNFPSKLIEYTAAALPLLIWGPSTSSAVTWATGEPGVAALVTDPGEAAMGVVLKRLAEDMEWRFELGRKSAMAGRKHFSPEKIEASFYHALQVA